MGLLSNRTLCVLCETCAGQSTESHAILRGGLPADAFGMPTEDELNALAYRVRGAGLTVHQKLGPGCFESAYAPCFAYELTQRKIVFRSRVSVTLRYETVEVPHAYELDFLIAERIVIELKALEKLSPIHSRQLQTYLKLTGRPLGFIFNFGAANFLAGVERQVNGFPQGTVSMCDLA